MRDGVPRLIWGSRVKGVRRGGLGPGMGNCAISGPGLSTSSKNRPEIENGALGLNGEDSGLTTFKENSNWGMGVS